MRTRITVVATLTLAAMMVGCGSSKHETPKAALEAMGKALSAGDSEAFVACFNANEAQTKVLTAVCDMTATTKKFQDAMVKAYGKDAVKNRDKGLQEMIDGTWLEKVTIQVDGDKAVATKEGEKQPLDLVKKDGGWKIDAASMLKDMAKQGATPEETSQNTEKALTMMNAMTDAYKQAMPEIGKEGKSAKDIQQMIGAAMMKAMFANMPKMTPTTKPAE